MDSNAETCLLLPSDSVNGVVDYRGRPVIRSKSGKWKSAWIITAVEVAERFAYYGILSNLITYLTGPLHQSTASAAVTINVWVGTLSLIPFFGAFIADSYLGRYHSIIVASILYPLGLGLLAVSAMFPSPTNSESHSSQMQVIFFFVGLYLMAVGQGWHKPCVQAFAADQFDVHHPEECKARSSFFTWWFCTSSAGVLVALFTLNYIQDNLSWVLGFGIPCLVMIVALIVFLLGTKTYRFYIERHDKSPFMRIGRVFAVALRNRQKSLSNIVIDEESCAHKAHQCSNQFTFLHKALLGPNEEACSLNEIEEAKAILRLIPIWATSLIFGIVFAQFPTFFTKQGATMNRTMFGGFDIPAATLQSLVYLGIIFFSPIYDRVFVPIAKSITNIPSGITMLQRTGIGIFISTITVVIAALVEAKRLHTAEEYGIVDEPNATVPMSVSWLIPQYLSFGIAKVFAMVGLQEFFYDQVPNELRSMGVALYLSIFGVGSFLSSFLISVIEVVTGKEGQSSSWFANNLNQAHLDYFYWLLAGLSLMELSLFIIFAKSYTYNQRGKI